MSLRTRLLIPLAAIVVAGLFLVFSRESRRPEVYLLILVSESNTKGLSAVPLEGDCPRAVSIDEAGRALRPLRPEYAPDSSTRCLVVRDSDFAGVRVASEAFKVRSFPFELGMDRPIAILTSLPVEYGDGPPGGGVPVVDDSMRLYRGTMVLSGVSREGVASLTFEGRQIALRPGEQWTAARYRQGSTVSEIYPGPEWEGALRGAFERGDPISRVSVFNYGFWEKGRVTQ